MISAALSDENFAVHQSRGLSLTKITLAILYAQMRPDLFALFTSASTFRPTIYDFSPRTSTSYGTLLYPASQAYSVTAQQNTTTLPHTENLAPVRP